MAKKNLRKQIRQAFLQKFFELILKENEELKSKVIDLMKNKNHESAPKRQLETQIFSYFSNQPTFLASQKQKTHILEPKQKEVFI